MNKFEFDFKFGQGHNSRCILKPLCDFLVVSE